MNTASYRLISISNGNRSGFQTFKTIVAWKQPLTGGISRQQFLMAACKDSRFEISQRGVATSSPCALRSCTSSWAVLFCAGPLRERRMRCLAPLLAIHWDMLRPIPPRPPATTYVALGSSMKFEVVGITVYTIIRVEFYTCAHLLTGTWS